jgi:EAL domain-containing protein (putative c-di-GMP-specific phosphodiesterase class I)
MGARLSRAVLEVAAASPAAPDGISRSARVFAGAQIAWQPIVSLSTGEMTAVEALTRFPLAHRSTRRRTPTEGVLLAAHDGGYGVELELACVHAALTARASLPPGLPLFVNVSPAALHAFTSEPLAEHALRGVVIEVTEHAAADYSLLNEDLLLLRQRGAAIAVDDVGTGYAGLLRLAGMRPDFVKVDREVVAGVGDSVAQAAVLEALVTLAHRLGAEVIAEGVERLDDIAELARFDVDHVQGYAVARPRTRLMPLAPTVIKACRAARRSLFGESVVFPSTAGRTRDLYTLTAALAGAGTVEDMAAALQVTASDLGVDDISLSILESETALREVAHIGNPVDPSPYALENYPATVQVMRSLDGLEIQLDDPTADPAECRLMRAHGLKSLLMVPIHDGVRAFGLLEFGQRKPRRWTAQDIAHARGLAEHLSAVMARLSGLIVG